MSKQQTQGQASPRWAFWKPFLILCKDGSQYLFRLRIIQTPWFGIYLHDIFEPDGDRDPHNHPWSFVSIVLRGWYIERLYAQPERTLEHYRVRHYKQFSAHRMDRESAHRIVEAGPGLKTLILVGPRRAGWGFFTKDGYVPWQEYDH